MVSEQSCVSTFNISKIIVAMSQPLLRYSTCRLHCAHRASRSWASGQISGGGGGCQVAGGGGDGGAMAAADLGHLERIVDEARVEEFREGWGMSGDGGGGGGGMAWVQWNQRSSERSVAANVVASARQAAAAAPPRDRSVPSAQQADAAHLCRRCGSCRRGTWACHCARARAQGRRPT